MAEPDFVEPSGCLRLRGPQRRQLVCIP